MITNRVLLAQLIWFAHRQTNGTVWGMMTSRVTCGVKHLLSFVTPALGFIQEVGRMLHETEKFAPCDPKMLMVRKVN